MENNPMALLLGILLVAVLALLMVGVGHFDGCLQNDFLGTGNRSVDQTFR